MFKYIFKVNKNKSYYLSFKITSKSLYDSKNSNSQQKWKRKK